MAGRLGRWLLLPAALLLCLWVWLAGPRPHPVPMDIAPAPLPPGAGPLKVLAWGTSLTQEGTWPEGLGPRLAACLGRAVTVQRLARNGATSDWGLSVADQAVAARPDVVLLEFAVNDADIRRGVGLAAARANHRAMLERLEAGVPDARIVLMTMNPATGLRGLLRPRQAAHDADYALLAQEGPGRGLLDLAPRWRDRIRAADWSPDGLHPRPEVAEAVILPPLLALLGGMAGRKCTAA